MLTIVKFMQTFTGQFYVNKKIFAFGSQLLFPVALGYIYQLPKFDDLKSCGSKDIYSNLHPASCTNNPHHNIKNLVNHMMVKNTKT